MFKGTFTYQVDAKGRLSIPAKLRKYIKPEANDTFVMTAGSSQCIELYPLNLWSAKEEKLMALNEHEPFSALYRRKALNMASEDTMDSQSRILIPGNLLNYAKIEKEVVVLGNLDKIEVWNPELFNDYMNKVDISFEDLAARVMVR